MSDDLRKALLVYISSHNRPMAELLRPQFKDIAAIHDGEFASMAKKHLPLEALILVRERLVALIHQGLTDDERQFLLSFKNRKPEWPLLGLEGVSELPAVKWKQINLIKVSDDKHRQAFEKLEAVLTN